MEKYIYDNNNGIWYELHGDYYLPCLIIPEEEVHFEEKASQVLFGKLKG